MAKRKRLTPPDPARVDAAGPLETKGMFTSYPNGVAPTRTRPSPPIADVAGDAATVAALEEVSETLSRARAEGRMVLDLPLDQIDAGYLVRDRVVADETEMTTLMASLRARGQQTPIEVTALADGRYGLISGWRRLTALRQLAKEDAKFGSVLALMRSPAEAADAYLAMVEENEIRVGLSYFERARIAAKAVEQGVYATEKAALLSLYHAASRAKRSKIRSFLTVVHALDGHLGFPGAMGERAGLTLAKALDGDPDLAGRLHKALKTAKPKDGEAELAVIQSVMQPEPPSKKSPKQGVSEPVLDQDEIGLAPRSISVSSGADGQLVLSGAGVTEALRPALMVWLKAWEERDL